MRSQRAIENRLKDRVRKDMTGFEWTMYVDYLDYERVHRIMPNLKRDEWQVGHDALKGVAIRDTMVNYVEVMWTKLLEGKSGSVRRGLGHYVAWFWLAGDTKFSTYIDDFLNNENLQKSKTADTGMLKLIERHLGVEIEQ